MVQKQSNWHHNEPDSGNAFLFLAVLYRLNFFASTALGNNDLKDYTVTKSCTW